MGVNIHEFWHSYNKLAKMMEDTNSEADIVLDFFQTIKSIYSSFSRSLRNSSENFLKRIAENKEKFTERNYQYYQYAANYVLKLADLNKQQSENIDLSACIPFQEFSNNIRDGNKEIIDIIRKDLNNIENSRILLKKHQENFYKLARSAEKLQENFEKLAMNESKSEDQVQKAQDKMLKLKMESEEAAENYRKQINMANQHWALLYDEFKPTFEIYEENEVSRSAFTKNTIISLVKISNKFYGGVKENEKESILEDPEPKFKELDAKTNTRANLFQVLTFGSLNQIMKEQPLEEYVAYEAKKKMDELAILRQSEQDDYTVVYGATSEKDLQFLLDVTKKFAPVEPYKPQAPKESRGSRSSSNESFDNTTREETKSIESMDTQPESVRKKLESPRKNSQQKAERTPEDEDKKVAQVLKNPVNRKFALENLSKNKSAKDGTVKLPSKTFDQLSEFTLRLLKKIINDKDYENLAGFLPLLNKYYCLKDGHRDYLFKSFRTFKLWEDIEVWEGTLKIFYERRLIEELPKKKGQGEKGDKSNSVGKFLSIGATKLQGLFDKKAKGEIQDKETLLQSLKELNVYISKLSKNLQVANQIILDLGKKQNLEIKELKDLCYQQKDEVNEILRDRIDRIPTNKSKRVAKKWVDGKGNSMLWLYGSLPFLEPKDIVKVLELNRELRKMFKKKVYRTIFSNFGDIITRTQRAKIWCNLLEIDDLKVDYHDYLEEFKEIRTEKEQRNVEEVIIIDVQRSFLIHKDFNQQLLQDLLKAYAAYDRDISYCQGMNYMMGFIYVTTKDSNEAFKIFCCMMDLFLKELFEKEFANLKRYFYKFTRCMELMIPDLAVHFREEKIDTSFFIAPWLITVFTSAFQYTENSRLLEKIWDFFLLDGVKIIFKAGLLLLRQHKDKLLSYKFDDILNFMTELGKQEVFSNFEYFKTIVQNRPEGEWTSQYKFVKNFGHLLTDLHITQSTLQILQNDFEVFENKLPKIFKTDNKKKQSN